MQDVWHYCTVYNSTCEVIKEQTLWRQVACCAWLQNPATLVGVSRSALRSLNTDLRRESWPDSLPSGRHIQGGREAK